MIDDINILVRVVHDLSVVVQKYGMQNANAGGTRPDDITF